MRKEFFMKNPENQKKKSRRLVGQVIAIILALTMVGSIIASVVISLR